VVTFAAAARCAPGNRGIRAEVSVRLAVRADLGGSVTPPGRCGVSAPPVVRFASEAPAQGLTEQQINDRLARGAVSSDAALAILRATACPGFGTRPSYLPAGQVAGAGAARLAQATGQSRGARC
jgi:hypothetical protein